MAMNWNIIYSPSTENTQMLSWCQLCCYWWHWWLSMITSNTTSEDRVSIVTTLCSQCHIPSITMWFPQPTFITASHPYNNTVGPPLILKLLGRPHKIDFTIAFDILERDGTQIDNIIWNQSALVSLTSFAAHFTYQLYLHQNWHQQCQ